MTALVSGSIFRTALQQGQVTSNGLECLAISDEMILQKGATGLQAQGKDLEQVKHLPAQEEYGDQHRANRQQFPEGHAIAIGLETFDHQAEDVKSGEAEDECPEDVIGVAFFGGLKERGHGERGPSQFQWKDHCQGAELDELIDRGQQVQAGSPLGKFCPRPEARTEILHFFESGVTRVEVSCEGRGAAGFDARGRPRSSGSRWVG